MILNMLLIFNCWKCKKKIHKLSFVDFFFPPKLPSPENVGGQ